MRSPSPPKALLFASLPEDELWQAIRDLVTEGWVLLKRLTRPYQLSFLQYHMLRAVAGTGASTPSRLAVAVGVSPPAITVLITGLERRGWVRRSTLPGDRRKVQISLTPKAVRMLSVIDRQRKEVLRVTLEAVPVAHQREMAETIRALTRRLQAERAPTEPSRRRERPA